MRTALAGTCLCPPMGLRLSLSGNILSGSGGKAGPADETVYRARCNPGRLEGFAGVVDPAAWEAMRGGN